MAGRLTLSAPINVPNVAAFQFARFVALDEVAKVMIVEFVSGGAGGIVYTSHDITVGNGFADVLAAAGSPQGYMDRVGITRVTGAPYLTEFDTLFAAYKAGGRNQLMTQMQADGILPAGAVA